MFKNILNISLRNLWKYKAYSTITLAGLAIGIGCFILIAHWVQDEFSYDLFHDNANRIVRVAQLDTEDTGQGICRVGAPRGPVLQATFHTIFFPQALPAPCAG